MEEFKDCIQIISWFFAIAVATTAVTQFFQANKQRRKEYRWRRTEAAMKLVDGMVADPEYITAATILDYSPCRVDLPRIGPIVVDIKIVEVALAAEQPDEPQFTIRMAFDTLFYHMARLNNCVNHELVIIEDVSFPISYYIEKLAQHHDVFDAYLKRNKLLGAIEFLNKFHSWTPDAKDNS